MVVGTLIFFFNDTATTEIYTLSLHDALPISLGTALLIFDCRSLIIPPKAVVSEGFRGEFVVWFDPGGLDWERSEEHTSELQSLTNLVCRLLLEKKKNTHHSLKLSSSTSHI